MKHITFSMKQILLLALLAFMTGSCIHENFDEPPTAKTYDFDANTTIAELKAMYDEEADTNKIESDIIIKGIVVSSDETGNFYKKLVLQDSTGGIEIQIDQFDLFVQYQVGTEMLVKCENLYIGDYGGVLQLGTSIERSGSFVNVIRMPAVVMDMFLFPTGNFKQIEPDTLAIGNLKDEHINTLVALKNVQFVDGQAGNATYADAVNQTTQNRTVVEYNTNSTILMRNSGFASFAADTLPEGSGVIVGVYSVFNSDKQLFIRDLDDVQLSQPRYTGGGGGNQGEGTGTKNDPYNVAKAISDNTGTLWVEGYIVGCINDISISTATFTAPFESKTNILIADDPDETNINNCLAVQLPPGDIRTAINLNENGALHKKIVMLKGELTTYFGVPGLKSTNGYWMNGTGIDPDIVPEGLIFKESFTSDISGFTAFDITGTAEWNHGNFDNGCAVANGYQEGANEDWLVSPAINTTGYATVELQVKQALNFIKSNGWNDARVLVSNDYDGSSSPDQQGTWHVIEFNTKPSGNNWTFTLSEKVDITQYAGETMYVALKYLSTDTEAATWEVSEVLVFGSNE